MTWPFSSTARWFVPAGAAVAVAAALVVPPAIAAASPPDLPERSPEQLIADVLGASPVALAGTATWTADLGLPELPAMGAAGGVSPTDLVSGTHTVQVWYDGDQGARAAMNAVTSQYTVVTNGSEAWAYSSADNAATHVTGIPDHAGAQLDPATIPTPDEVAKAVVAHLTPSTTLAVDTNVRVAGQAAYRLVVTPNDAKTLIGQIRISIDAETSLPLRVEVFAAGHSKAAIDTGFTDISYGAQAPSLFDYTPPAGTTITEHAVPTDLDTSAAGTPSADGAFDQADHAGVEVLGEGWSAVVKIPGLGDPRDALDALASGGDVSALAGSDLGGSDVAGIVSQLTEEVPEGIAVHMALGSALVTWDGTVYAGAVPVSVLQDLAG